MRTGLRDQLDCGTWLLASLSAIPAEGTKLKDVMACETRAFFNSARCVVGVALLGAMLLCAARVPAQETSQKRGTVKGTVSLVNTSQELSTSGGLQLELKPLAESVASLSAVTDEAGNYKFEDVAGGDY